LFTLNSGYFAYEKVRLLIGHRIVDSSLMITIRITSGYSYGCHIYTVFHKNPLMFYYIFANLCTIFYLKNIQSIS